MKAKRFVKYTFHSTRAIGSYSFSNYKTITGKKMKYKDINGEDSQITWNSNIILLDMDNEGHVLQDNFLKYNPSVLSKEWVRLDLHKAEANNTKRTLDSAKAVIEAAKMTDIEVKQYATIARLNLSSEIDVLRARIIEIAQSNADLFMATQFDPEKDLRVFIIDAIKLKKLNYKNNTFFYNKEAIGTNEEQVLVWLKDNKDILAILKHEIRAIQAPKKKLVNK
jgi:hypothetical protein|tara:strand:- start:3290 stop:3958 length:669 start_codon:yes stop_codon:yes gene_type:complete